MEPLEHHQFTRAQMQVVDEALDRGEYGARERLLHLCRSLIALLEIPMESITRMGWAEVSQSPANPYQAPCSHFFKVVWPGRLSKARMMKHLAAMNVVGESGPETFYGRSVLHCKG